MGISAMSAGYQQARPGQLITYVVQQNGKMVSFSLPAVTFTWEMWLQNYGLALFAGISWLLMGGILLATAKEWTGAVEGITMLPPAMLFLLYSHWGNVQRAAAFESRDDVPAPISRAGIRAAIKRLYATT